MRHLVLQRRPQHFFTFCKPPSLLLPYSTSADDQVRKKNRRHKAGTPTLYLSTLKLSYMIILSSWWNVRDVLLPSKAKTLYVLDLILLGLHRDFAPSYSLSLPPAFLALSYINISTCSNYLYLLPPPTHTYTLSQLWSHVLSSTSSFNLFFPIHNQISGRHIHICCPYFFPIFCWIWSKWLLLSI